MMAKALEMKQMYLQQESEHTTMNILESTSKENFLRSIGADWGAK